MAKKNKRDQALIKNTHKAFEKKGGFTKKKNDRMEQDEARETNKEKRGEKSDKKGGERRRQSPSRIRRKRGHHGSERRGVRIKVAGSKRSRGVFGLMKGQISRVEGGRQKKSYSIN